MRVISASVQRKCCASSNTSRPSEHCVLLKTQFRGIVQSAYKVCVPVQKKKKKETTCRSSSNYKKYASQYPWCAGKA